MELVLSGAFLVFVVGGLIVVKVQLAKRPTWTEANERYKETKVCDVIHEGINQKLECLPGIQKELTTISTILKERDKK